jgi:hypothetical protein
VPGAPLIGSDESQSLDLFWDEKRNSLAINKLGIDSPDGSISFKGTFGNVSRELFGGSLRQMEVAALGITLGHAGLRLEGKAGSAFIDGVAEGAAAETRNVTPRQLRARWRDWVAHDMPQFFGGDKKAKAVSEALAGFMDDPRSLSISVKARDGIGPSAIDIFTFADDPAAIFEKLDVNVSAAAGGRAGRPKIPPRPAPSPALPDGQRVRI